MDFPIYRRLTILYNPIAAV